MSIFQAKPMNYFSGLLSFASERALWDECDGMEHTESNLSSVRTITLI